MERTVIYLLLLNFPIIILGIAALAYNRSLIGIQISCDMDMLHIIVLGGYICYLEESRQTPICGFLFVRDLACLMGVLACFINFYIFGEVSIKYGLILAGFYLIYYIMLQFEEKMEDGVLRVLKIRGNDVYNAAYLLTQ